MTNTSLIEHVLCRNLRDSLRRVGQQRVGNYVVLVGLKVSSAGGVGRPLKVHV